jgi:hypothetical protein
VIRFHQFPKVFTCVGETACDISRHLLFLSSTDKVICDLFLDYYNPWLPCGFTKTQTILFVKEDKNCSLNHVVLIFLIIQSGIFRYFTHMLLSLEAYKNSMIEFLEKLNVSGLYYREHHYILLQKVLTMILKNLPCYVCWQLAPKHMNFWK